MPDMTIEPIAFAQPIDGIPLFGGLVIFWEWLNEHIASLHPNSLNVNITGGLHLEIPVPRKTLPLILSYI